MDLRARFLMDSVVPAPVHCSASGNRNRNVVICSRGVFGPREAAGGGERGESDLAHAIGGADLEADGEKVGGEVEGEEGALGRVRTPWAFAALFPRHRRRGSIGKEQVKES